MPQVMQGHYPTVLIHGVERKRLELLYSGEAEVVKKDTSRGWVVLKSRGSPEELLRVVQLRN